MLVNLTPDELDIIIDSLFTLIDNDILDDEEYLSYSLLYRKLLLICNK